MVLPIAVGSNRCLPTDIFMVCLVVLQNVLMG